MVSSILYCHVALCSGSCLLDIKLRQQWPSSGEPQTPNKQHLHRVVCTLMGLLSQSFSQHVCAYQGCCCCRGAAVHHAGEQTWPTEEELSAAAAAAAASRRMRKRRLPAGTSEYQAAWILDDEEDGSDGSEYDLEGEFHQVGRGVTV
jgi:hypothetical protein